MVGRLHYCCFVFDILIYLQIKSAGEAVGSSGRLEDLWNKVE